MGHATYNLTVPFYREEVVAVNLLGDLNRAGMPETAEAGITTAPPALRQVSKWGTPTRA